MIRHSHKLLLAAVLSGFSAMSAATVDAGCHGNSGGSRGSSHHYPHSSYSSPVYSQPTYPQPVYSQPIYSQPAFPQQVYSQPSYPQSGYPQQTVYSQSSYRQSQPQYGQMPQQLPQTQQAPMLQPSQMSQPLASQQQQPQTQVPQAQVQQVQVPGGTAQSNASQAVGAPQNLGLTNPAPTQAPTQAAAQAPASTDAPATGSTASVNEVQQSALLALGGFAPPQAAATQSAVQVPQMQQPTFAGTWTANLSNGARVQLLLQADGNFSWTAVNKDGQSTSFQGTYSMDNGSLSLSRSTDGQKLSGSLTNSSAGKFSFKLSDAQSSSLDFVRG